MPAHYDIDSHHGRRLHDLGLDGARLAILALRMQIDRNRARQQQQLGNQRLPGGEDAELRNNR